MRNIPILFGKVTENSFAVRYSGNQIPDMGYWGGGWGAHHDAGPFYLTSQDHLSHFNGFMSVTVNRDSCDILLCGTTMNGTLFTCTGSLWCKTSFHSLTLLRKLNHIEVLVDYDGIYR